MTFGKEWTEADRSKWNHYDQMATALAGIASTVFALVYVTGRDAPIPHSAAFCLMVTVYMNLWSLGVRHWRHYVYKSGLVFASLIPFSVAIGLLMYLMLMS